jgi:pimeloyl-ACP methyl ester carboxylesterase
MRRALVVVTALGLVAACARVPPAELARDTPFALAREHGRFVEVRGLRVFAITMGRGRDVVLIHGNGASTYSWRHALEPLATRYRVHALDLPGYGFSDKPDDGRYDAAWLEDHLVGYLDAAGVQRAVLVGNSMGGEVATEAAVRDPARVAALVLLGAGGLPQARADGVPLSLRMLTWPVIGPALQRLPIRGRVAARLREAVYDPATLSEADIDVYYAAFASAGGGNAFLARLRAEPVDRSGSVSTIAAPTLVITGDTDRLVPPATARRYHELIRGSELLVLEHTGHLPQEERPERIVGEIVRWTDAHP